MASPYAFATLLTSDQYLPGALTLVAALQDVHPSPAIPPEVDFQTVCLVTPETLDVSTIKILRKTFDVVIGVELIAQKDERGLALLGRPDLNKVLTKLHVFRLTQYSKIIFLDADVLPIRPLSHLFTLPHDFSAIPDVGWPDIFNSGVLVLSPGEDKFSELQDLLKSKGSWDGGDQGILNEWRGNDWNKLSFTYNTTPTAAYTYAPAYERFGKKISAIHFIGPNKPWKSIQYRAPFLSQREQPESSQQAYNYDALVDKWFNVYDTHYRVQSIIPEKHFEVQKYVSVWDEGAPSSGEGRALSLEELRLLAIQGMNAADLASENRFGDGDGDGEGEYKSLPLEGRIDLMRPQPPPEQKDADHSSISTDTRQYPLQQQRQRQHSSPLTPGPHEAPPSPHPRSIPLPPTHLLVGDEFAAPHEIQHQDVHDSSQSLQPHQPPTQEQPSSEFRRQTPARPPSPPKMLWNPAIEPPPNTAPPSSAFLGDTYFQNIWDQPPSKHHDRTHPHQHHHTTSLTPDSDAFFQPPPPSQIPETLLLQGHYRNVTGESDHGSSTGPNPDINKVKHVFPWEDKPRAKPARVFPTSDGPSPTWHSPTTQLSVELAETPEPILEQVVSPLVKPLPPKGLPANLAYANAWDTVPSIQRYASRLVRQPPPIPPPAPFDSEDYRRGRKTWDDRTEASSRDGDDEDNTDSDDDEPVVSRLADSDNETSLSGSTNRTRSRRGSSVSASYGVKAKKKEYRVRGVQTISPEMREQAVQVSILVDFSKVSNTPRPSQDQQNGNQETIRPRRASLSLQTGGSRKPQWAPSSGSITLPPIVSREEGGLSGSMAATGTSTGRGGDALDSRISPSPDVVSPREYIDSPGPVRTNSSSSTITLTATRRSSGTPPLGPSRQISNESSVTSPPSSAGPISPPEGQPIGSQRKVGRVFDPARGVELFKRGSEEVLARFLKMSSWEEDGSPQR